jgi:hypothetical protein
LIFEHGAQERLEGIEGDAKEEALMNQESDETLREKGRNLEERLTQIISRLKTSRLVLTFQNLRQFHLSYIQA